MTAQYRRDREDGGDRADLVAGLAAAETMRNAAESANLREESAKKEEEKVSIFWRVFGGTLLSIVALAAVTLFNNLSGNIAELRSELNKEREARSLLVKKDEFTTRMTQQYERIRAAEGLQNTLTAFKAEHDGLKEKVTANATCLEAVRKDAGGLDSIRERVAGLEAVKKDIAGLDLMKERLAALTLDVKATRDEVTKAAQEISQNRSFDQERKALHDSQFKQFEETLKDLGKAMQECRERVARLEVQQQPKAVPMPTPEAKPVSLEKP